MEKIDTSYLLRTLREAFPHGHEEFIPTLLEKMQLHSDKNHDYAAGGDPLGNFDRVGTILGLYPGLDPSHPLVVVMTYSLKQIDAILWGLAKQIQHKVEGLESRYSDVLVYAGISICWIRQRARDAAQAMGLIQAARQPTGMEMAVRITPGERLILETLLREAVHARENQSLGTRRHTDLLAKLDAAR